MWKIMHIFDGDYGCEEQIVPEGDFLVSVSLENETGEKRVRSVPDGWLRQQGLDVGSFWPFPLS